MKRNQLALVFLTVLTMLAVWYFKTPSATPDDEDGSIIVSTVTTEKEKFQTMRDAVRKERNATIENLNAIIADEDSSLVSINLALKEKAELSSLNELEVLLETKVINLGYSDAFVHSSVYGVEVIVVSNSSDALAALDIINTIHESLDDAENVVVNFMTTDEINKL